MRGSPPSRLALFFAGLGSTLLFLAPRSVGHGGTYRGPGDTVTPTLPNPPAGPTTGGNAPGASGGGIDRPTFPAPGVGAGGFGGSMGGSVAPGPLWGSGVDLGPDLSGWELWWEINQDRFLDLRNRRKTVSLVVTGSDQFFLGEGRAPPLPGMPSRERLRAEVVPALLEGAGDPETAEACLLALAKIGEDPRLRAQLEERLADRVLAVREAATLGLGILGVPQALSPLGDLLAGDAAGRALAGQREVSARLQSFAAVALALLGRARESTRAEVHAALLRAVESAATLRSDVRAASALALGIVPPPDEEARARALDLLRRRWAHPREDLQVRAHLPLAIGRLAGFRAEEFVRLFRSAIEAKATEREVRQSCVLALGLLVSPDSDEYAPSVDLLGEVLRAGESSSRGFAAIALGEIGGDRARLVLERALRSGRPLVRPWVALGLGVLAHGARPKGTPSEAASPVPALRELLRRSRAPSAVAAASIALGLAGDAGSSALILDALDRIGEERSRGHVCLGLGLAGGGAGKAEMMTLVRESTRRPDLLRSAAVASLLLGDAGVVPELLRLLEGPPAAAEVAVLNALAQVGDGQAIASLVSLLRNRGFPGITRRAAATALGRIGDRRTLPWRAEVAADQNYLAFPTALFDPTGATGLLDFP